MLPFRIAFFLLLFNIVLLAQKPTLVVPTGHSGALQKYTCSPDGQFYLSAGGENAFILWDAAGRQLRSYPHEEGYCRHLEFSPDSKHFVAAVDSNAYLVDVWTGKQTLLFTAEKKIFRLRYSPDGLNLGVMADQDSIVRLWSFAEGKFKKKFSAPQILADFAFSPDGKHIATSDNGPDIRVWSVETGRLRNAFPNKVADADNSVKVFPLANISFSPDGKNLLASASFVNVQLYEAETGKVLRTWDGFSGFVSPDGRYYAILTTDNKVNIFHADSLGGKRYTSLSTIHSSYNGPPLLATIGITFCPDSRHAIVDAYGSMELWDIPTKSFKQDLFRAVASCVHSADFSPDGKQCVISTGHLLQQIHFPPGLPLRTFKGHTDAITNVKYSRDGAFIATSAKDFSARTWEMRSGKPLGVYKGKGAMWPVPGFVEALGLSPDDSKLYKFTPLLVAFDLRDTTQMDTLVSEDTFGSTRMDISDNAQVLAMNFSNIFSNTGGIQLVSLQAGRAADPPRKITWGAASEFKILPDSRTIAIADEDSISLWDIETLREIRSQEVGTTGLGFPTALDISSDGKLLVTGDENGKTALWSLPELKFVRPLKGHQGRIHAARFSKDSRWLITTSSDQTTRIWNVSNGQEVAQIVLFGENDWAVVSPDGMFDASPGGMNFLYFVVENQAIELSQLKERYYEPGLLSKLLGFSEEPLRAVPKFADLPLYPVIKARIHLDTLHIELQKQNGGIGKVSLFINGQERAFDINPKRLEKLDIDLTGFRQFIHFDTINDLQLRAYNADGWLKSQGYVLPYNPKGAKGSGSGSQAPGKLGGGPPTLYALMIGTSNYAGEKLDLRFPDKDASAMAEAIKAVGAELFKENVKVELLQSGAASPEGISTKANIEAAFERLTKTASKDILVLYFSGHGVNYGTAENAQFYYLTRDIATENLSDPEIRNKYTISSNELTTWMSKIPAEKRVLIFDACNSGKVVEDFASLVKKDLSPEQIRAFDRMKDRTGMFILTGSAADKVSYEASEYGQGLLTYSLLLGMSGFAIDETDPRVDVMRLFQFSRDKVPELAKSVGGIQTPILAFPSSGASFDIGVVNSKVKIPLAAAKPVFVRNNFQDENTFDDELGLSNLLATYLQGLTAKGAQAEIVYVDRSEFENAWSLKGRYTVEGDAVDVTARLFNGKKIQGEFVIKGKKSDLNGLVESMLEEVMKIIQK
ncbi:MAG: caspase family protein [Saprospiraceae bacterium]|nr:caspase family protein [Saprospiraceae bacterium]